MEKIEATHDVVVYGATPGGVFSAIAARRAYPNADIAIIEPTGHVGGMLSAGMTDISAVGKFAAAGGLLQEFWRAIAVYYDLQGGTCPYAEPHVYEGLFEDWLEAEGIFVKLNASVCAVPHENGMATGLSLCETKEVVSGRFFVDATYEGDLLPLASLPYAFGRESQSVWNESLGGLQAVPPTPDGYGFGSLEIDPFEPDGTPKPLVCENTSPCSPAAPRAGLGDGHVQSYNLRACAVEDGSGIPFTTPPKSYNASIWQLQADVMQAAGQHAPISFTCISINHNGKCNLNDGAGPISLNPVGEDFAWALSNWTQRWDMLEREVEYSAGFFYFLATDPRVPSGVQERVRRYSLCADEYVDHGHWPFMTYVREGRRLQSDSVFTQADWVERVGIPHISPGTSGILQAENDSIGLASWGVDSHTVQRIPRIVNGKNITQNEGNVDLGTSTRQTPYSIPLGIILPPKPTSTLSSHPTKHANQPTIKNPDSWDGSTLLLHQGATNPPQNIAVAVAVSSSHIGFSALRTEATFMVMGEAVGTLIGIALQHDVPSLRQVEPATLLATLDAHGVIRTRQQMMNNNVSQVC